MLDGLLIDEMHPINEGSFVCLLTSEIDEQRIAFFILEVIFPFP